MSTTIAVVFDFDDTLAPDSTTELLVEHGVDIQSFWQDEFPERIDAGYDPTVAYLSALLSHVGESEQLGELRSSDLSTIADSLNEQWKPGIPELFDDLDDIVAEYNDVSIEYYIISEGIESLIEQTMIAQYCDGIYASRLATDEDGVFTGIKRPISFTDKTRHLYEINKGITPAEAMENPFEVNKEIPYEERRVPFENMIYIGDGITDIPCFSLIKDRDGRVFGVVNEEESPKQRAVLEVGSPRRAGNLNEPDYSPEAQLGSLLRLTVEGLCTNNTIDQLEAL